MKDFGLRRLLARPLVWLVIAAVVAAGGYLAFGGSGGARAGIEIETVEASVGDVRRVVSTSGAVRALVTVEVGSQLSGQISELHADFNTQVEAGDVVARLDPQTYETRVREGEAAVVVAQSQVQVQEANVARARANLQRAQSEFDRMEALLARGTAAQAAYDTALADVESARADVQVAEAGLVNAQATLGQREASLDSARIDLERTVIRSPIDGIVVSREVDVGQTVAASMTAPILFTIAEDLARIQIDAQVDEADIGQVEDGQMVSFDVDAFPDARFQGVVDQIRLAALAESNVVTYTVVISARNPGRRLLPGMTANVDIVTGARADVLTVDNRAIRFEPRGAMESMVTAEGRTVLAESAEDDSPFPRRGFPAAIISGGPPGGFQNGAQSGGRQGGFGGGMLEQVREELELTDDQVQQIQTTMRASFQSAFQGGTPGGFAGGDEGGAPDFSAMRERINAAIEGVLTPEQLERFREMEPANGEPRRRGRVWVETANGMLAPRAVILGVSDGDVTEVVGGDLEEGDRVVIRARERTV